MGARRGFRWPRIGSKRCAKPAGRSSAWREKLKSTAFGLNAERKARRAVARILAQPPPKLFNSLAITEVTSKRFLGVPYVCVRAQSRHIQESLFLFSPERIQNSGHADPLPFRPKPGDLRARSDSRPNRRSANRSRRRHPASDRIERCDLVVGCPGAGRCILADSWGRARLAQTLAYSTTMPRAHLIVIFAVALAIPLLGSLRKTIRQSRRPTRRLRKRRRRRSARAAMPGRCCSIFRSTAMESPRAKCRSGGWAIARRTSSPQA